MSERIGPYQLEEMLGEGGMGTVYAARHVRRGHPVAIKRIRAQRVGPDAARAFEREVRAVAALDHPHIVRVLDQGDHDGAPWLAMERAVGPLQRPADWDGVAAVLDQLLQGVAAAHGAGLLHLDVKASNILVRADGSHLLTDFGVALLRGRDAPDAQSWGSPPAMAPERFDGRPERCSPATDLYAVGVVAFELVQGAPPFPAATWAEAAHEHRTLPVPPLWPRTPVPPGFSEWVRTLLAKRPGERFASAADARRHLAAVHARGTVVAVGGHRGPQPSATLPPTAMGEPVAIAALAVGPVRPARPELPPRWPTRAQRAAATPGGLGLLDLLAVPYLERPEVTDPLWAGLVCAAEGRGPKHFFLRGPPGSGRTRAAERFVQQAIAEAGATALIALPDQPPGRWLAAPMGLSTGLSAERCAEAVALRIGLPPSHPITWQIVAAAREGVDAIGATLALIEQIPGPFVLWADGLDVLSAVAHPRVVLVRSGGAPAAGEQVIDLAPFDVPTTRALLAEWLGLAPDLVTDLADRAEGDLGLAITMVREGVASGRLTPTAHGLSPRDDTPLPLPEASRRLWRAAIPDFPDDQRWAIHRAAVLGPVVPLDAWSRAAPGAPVEALRDALVTLGLAVRTEGGLRWPSAALRAELLDDAAGELAAHHAACAAAVDGRWARGTHLLAAGQLEPALDLLFAEATETIAKGRMVAAARMLRRVEAALDAVGVPAQHLQRAQLALCYANLGPTHQGYAKTMAYNQIAADLARPHAQDPAYRKVLAAAVGSQIWLANVQLLPRVAAPLLDEDAALLPAGPTPNRWDRLGWHRVTLGDGEGAVEAFQRAVDAAVARGNTHLRYVSDASLGVAKGLAGHPDAIAHLQRAGQAMLAAGYHSARADLAVALGDATRHAGDLAASEAHYHEMWRASAEGEARTDVGFSFSWAAWLRAVGRPEEALAVVVGAQAEAQESGPTWAALSVVYEASCAAALGRPMPAGLAPALAALADIGFVGVDAEAALRSLDHPDAQALADRMAAALRAGRRASAGG
jgi:hypothetical protein